MPVAIGLKLKDENYFAQQSAGASANSRPVRSAVRECRQMEAPKPPQIELKACGLPSVHQYHALPYFERNYDT
jgi:hypothetical protein